MKTKKSLAERLNNAYTHAEDGEGSVAHLIQADTDVIEEKQVEVKPQEPIKTVGEKKPVEEKSKYQPQGVFTLNLATVQRILYTAQKYVDLFNGVVVPQEVYHFFQLENEDLPSIVHQIILTPREKIEVVQILHGLGKMDRHERVLHLMTYNNHTLSQLKECIEDLTKNNELTFKATLETEKVNYLRELEEYVNTIYQKKNSIKTSIDYILSLLKE